MFEVGKRYVSKNYKKPENYIKVITIYEGRAVFARYTIKNNAFLWISTIDVDDNNYKPYVKKRKVTRYGFWYKDKHMKNPHTCMYDEECTRNSQFIGCANPIPNSKFEVSIEVEE